MGEKIWVDKKRFEELEKYKNEDWKTLFLRTSAYIRDSLLYGILVPTNSDEETIKKIEAAKLAFKVVVEDICNEKYSIENKYLTYEDDKIIDKQTPLRLINTK